MNTTCNRAAKNKQLCRKLPATADPSQVVLETHQAKHRQEPPYNS